VIHCRECRVVVAPDACYCTACGAATTRHRKQVLSSKRTEAQRQARAGLVLAWVFGGTLAGGVLVSSFADEWSQMTLVLANALWMVVIALTGGVVLGLADHRRWLPLRSGWAGLAWAPLVGLLCIAIAWGYVGLLQAMGLVEGGEGEPAAGAPAAVLVAVLLVAPVLEEVLCRGVAWEAAGRLGGPRAAWVLSSILFAFLHGMNGGFLLELPHRLVGGFLLGALRARSGGLLPPIAAHFCWNGIGMLG